MLLLEHWAEYRVLERLVRMHGPPVPGRNLGFMAHQPAAGAMRLHPSA